MTLEEFFKEAISPYRLSNREKDVAIRWMMDYSVKEISLMLFLSEHTIKTVLKSINRKMEVSTKASLILKVMLENKFGYVKNTP